MAQTLYTFKANIKDLLKTQKEIDKLEGKLKKLKRTDAEYQAQRDKLKSQIGVMNQQFTSQANAIKGVNKQAKTLNSTAGRMVNVFKSAAIAIASAFAVRAIVGSVRGVIGIMTEFEAKMAAVRAISGATDKQFKELESSALKLGSSTVFTARQVAELQEEYARLGFSTKEIIAASDATLALAAATGESLANSAQTAGAVLRAFGYEATQTQRIAETMSAAFTGSALNLERFTESMKFAAPVAAATGFTVEETTTLLMKLADAGLRGSIAGNALKKIFLEIGTEGSKLSKKLGGPVQGIEQMDEALIKLTESGISAGEATDLLGQRAAPAFLALLDSAGDLTAINDDLTMTEGVVSEMAAIRLDTLQGDITLMKSALEGLGLALGESINLQLRSVVFRFTEWIRSITESPEKLAKLQKVIKAVGLAIVFLTTRLAAIGLMTFIYKAGKAVVAINAFRKALLAAKTMNEALKISFATTPWGAIISIIALFAGAVITAKAATSDLAGEMDETAMRTDRMVTAMERQIKAIKDLDEADTERARMLRQLKADFGDTLLQGVDVELATNDQLTVLEAQINSIGTGLEKLEKFEGAMDNSLALDKVAMRILNDVSRDLGSISSEIDNLAGTSGNNLKKAFSTQEITAYGETLLKAIQVQNGWSDSMMDSMIDVAEMNNAVYNQETGKMEETMMDSDEMILKFFAKQIQEIQTRFGQYSVYADKEVDNLVEKIEGIEVDGQTPLASILGMNTDDWTDVVGKVDRGMKNLKLFYNIQNKELQDIILQDPALESLIEQDNTTRLMYRKIYAERLEDFRDLTVAEQEIYLADNEEKLRLFQAAEEIYRLRQAGDNEEADLRMKVLANTEDERKRIEGFIAQYTTSLAVIGSEMDRFVSNLQKQFRTASDNLDAISIIALQKTKDQYKKLLKLQAKYFSDDIIRKKKQNENNLKSEQKALNDQLKLVERNLKDINKMRSEETDAGVGVLSAFISTNKSRYQAIKELDAEHYERVTSGLSVHKDEMLSIINAMYDEELSKKTTNNGLLIALQKQFNRDEEDLNKKRYRDLQDVLKEIEHLELDATIGEFIFDRNYIGQREQVEKDLKDTLLKIETDLIASKKRLEQDQESEETTFRELYDDRIKIVNDALQAELDATNNKTVETIKLIEEEKQAALDAVPEFESDGVTPNESYESQRLAIVKKYNDLIADENDKALDANIDAMSKHGDKILDLEDEKGDGVLDIQEKYDNAEEKLDADAKRDETKANNEHGKNIMGLTGDQLEAGIEAYKAAFSALSDLWDNRIAMEKHLLEESFAQRMEDIDREMNAELEAFEGNSQAQEDIRDAYELKKDSEKEVQDEKLRQLEKRRFMRNQKNMIAEAIMNGALAMTQTVKTTGPWGIPMNAIIAALVAAQVATISSQQFIGAKGGVIPEYGSGGMVYGPSHAQGGVKFNAGGRVVELEGGEAVINKRSTAMFKPALSAMNAAGGGKKFADGGITPGSKIIMAQNTAQDLESVADRIVSGINNKNVFMTESSVTDTQRSVSTIESNASIF